MVENILKGKYVIPKEGGKVSNLMARARIVCIRS